MSFVESPHPVEARKFVGEYLRFGSCNSTEDGDEAKDIDTTLFNDVLSFLIDRLNATNYMQYYSKLGFQTYEGTWTGLLGALMDNSIDIGLEPVTSHASRNQNMDFVFPLAETMFNIYIREQETTAVRDIFLAPFNPVLLACVFAVGFGATIVIYIISKFAPSVANSRSMRFTEALVWSTGILCQQGGSQTPSNPAASILLIVCLLFASVTYNSYAAFITSVLSVRVASVDTVSAVLQSTNLKIGYIRNGPDQMYLMSTKDVQLNAFYIRGYSEAENLVSSAEEGLFRAAKQDYAFFSEQRTARTTLRSLSQSRGRCSLRELPVPSTRAQLAFPLSKRSPYARPILVSLLQLRGAGVVARLSAALVPAMPTCEPPPRFASARAADVRSALVVFLIGLFASMFIGIVEYCWNKRCQLKKCVIGYFATLKIFSNS
ncbi:Glutamate receptor, ionotropic kainate 1 [Papilio machaon]|uniref:Glutamate receptor, ionotropic kainate 1 n=1 Tax=Papilio machaon TaxID=76193 RepID=A0A194R486_PAPMA|nr:Glutamate receptor, ionotropic kainate 1 [Papilio machaon]